MLKLEKGSDDIHIRIREKERFFNSLFLKALAAALLFHVLFFVVFQIRPFKMNSTFLFPPVKVQTEKPSHIAIQKELNDEIALLPPPPYAILYPQENFKGLKEDPKRVSLPDFQAENELLIAFQPQKVDKPKIQLFLSGNIATLNWIFPKTIDEKIAVFPHMDPLFVKYQILVDHEQGIIYWYEKIQSSGSPIIDQETEQVLLDMRTEGMIPFHLSGTIDFAIFSEAQG